MQYPYIITRRGFFFEDSWTYGDYRQYVCKLPDGRTQCAKRSIAPVLIMILGAILTTLVGMTITTLPSKLIAWDRAITMLIIGLVFLVMPVVIDRAGYVLMKAVGPVNNGTRRVFPGEEKKKRVDEPEASS